MRTDAEDLAWVVAHAKYFIATAFRGRATYDRIETATLEEAREAAKRLYTNRPVAIYAIATDLDGATLRQRHVENWSPKCTE